MYTQEELEEAKEYLRQRLDNERSMSKDVLRLLELYAGYLLSALYANASDEEIEALIAELIDSLLTDCEVLAVNGRDDASELIPLYMNSERNGDNLEGRVNKRAHTFFKEVFAVYVAGKLIGLNEKSLASSIKANLKHPWDNEVLIAAREMQKRGDIPSEYDFETPHFGKGVEISSYGALDKMLVYAIGDAWMYWQHEDAKAQGAKGYYVLRGSSYPCDICDEAANSGLHPMDDTEHIVPLHMNCVCYIVYTYVDRV